MTKKILSVLFAFLILILSFASCTTPAKSGSPSGSATPEASKTVLITPTPTIDPLEIRDPIGKMIVHFIDVGYSEAILIQTPNSRNILIDGGKTDQGTILTEYITKLGIKKIDFLILSCPSDDRTGGMTAIVENFVIGKVYMPKVGNDTQSFNALMAALNTKGINPLYVRTGTVIQVDDEVILSVVSPTQSNYDYLSDYSVVMRLLYRNNSMLFMGAAGETAEAQMIVDNLIIKADVLKLGNYGAYRTNTADFLARVAPKSAVLFSWPANASLLPNKEVLYKLADAGIDFYKTEGGNIIVNCDGEKVEFNRPPVEKAVRPTPEPTPVAITEAPTLAPTATPRPTPTPKHYSTPPADTSTPAAT